MPRKSSRKPIRQVKRVVKVATNPAVEQLIELGRAVGLALQAEYLRKRG